MNNDQRTKQRFVDKYLRRTLMSATKNDVSDVNFIVINGTDTVRVRWRKGKVLADIQDIDVSDMSVGQLMRKVGDTVLPEPPA